MSSLGPTAADGVAVWRLLRSRLGVVGAARLLARVGWQQARGKPFAGSRPADDAARGSQAQAGPAILLYRSLLHHRVEAGVAQSLVAEAITRGALSFLDRAVGPVSPNDLAPLSPPARIAFVRDRLDRFPNVEAQVGAVDGDAVSFTVTRCRLVELVREAGHPELASLFCAADAEYFGTTRPGLVLDRPTTLAAGGSACEFRIRRASIAEPQPAHPHS